MRCAYLAFGLVLFATGGRAEDPKKGATPDEKRKLLQTFVLACNTYSLKYVGKLPQKLEDVSKFIKDKEFVDKLATELNVHGFGRSYDDVKAADSEKTVMLYEKDAPKNGGLVLCYDLRIKVLTAEQLSKLLEKK